MKTDHQNIRIYLIVVILLQLIIVIFLGHQKQGYHVDEIFSFVFANSYENPKFDQGMYHTWFHPEYFSDMVKVSASHQFSYITTYQNQTRDVHPPFYYFILHTVGSIFPEQFSIWFGLTINIAFFVICNYFLYLISEKIFDNPFLTLLPSIVWGFSAGALSTVLFIRMYMLLTLLVVMTIYFHFLFIEKGASKTVVIILFILTILGIMTHYYFFMFIFLMAISCSAYIICLKNWHQLIMYVFSLSLAIIAGIIFYPSMLEQIFVSYRGQEAFDAIAMFSNYSHSIHAFYQLISAQQFSGTLTIFVMFLFLINLNKLVKRLIIKKNPRPDLREAISNDKRKMRKFSLRKYFKEYYSIYTLVITTFFMFVTIAIISPYQSTRYLYVIYPMVSILAVFFASKSLEIFTTKKKILIPIILLMFLIMNILSLNSGKIDYLYPGYNNVLSIADTYSDFSCVFITDRLWTLRSNVFELAKFEQTIFIPTDHMVPLPEIRSFDKLSRGVIIYIDNILNQEDILSFVVSSYGFENYDFLYALDLNSAYILYD